MQLFNAECHTFGIKPVYRIYDAIAKYVFLTNLSKKMDMYMALKILKQNDSYIIQFSCDKIADALKKWEIDIFKIIDTRISFYSRNTHLFPPKPKSSFRHLKRGIQDFHMNYVLVPADKAANTVVVV